MEEYLVDIQFVGELTANSQQKNDLYQEIFYDKKLVKEEKLELIKKLYSKESV